MLQVIRFSRHLNLKRSLVAAVSLINMCGFTLFPVMVSAYIETDPVVWRDYVPTAMFIIALVFSTAAFVGRNMEKGVVVSKTRKRS